MWLERVECCPLLGTPRKPKREKVTVNEGEGELSVASGGAGGTQHGQGSPGDKWTIW